MASRTSGVARRAGGRACAAVLTAVALEAAMLVATSATPSGADGNEVAGNSLAARSITAGTSFTCTITNAGVVRCWGFNNVGQLGQGDTLNRGDAPTETGLDLPPVDLGTGRTATAIAAGSSHVCAILDNGSVKCWGGGLSGKLGLGDTANRGDSAGEMGENLPAVDLGTGRTATAITAGGDFTCAVLDNASVKCWGSSAKGQLGLGDQSIRGDGPGEMGDALPAVNLGTGQTATAIAAGGSGHVCVILQNAQMKCWGLNSSGELGRGFTGNQGDSPFEMGDNLPTVDLGAGRTATAIAAGDADTCAVLDNGSVKCWGINTLGQLGQGNTTTRGDNANEMGDNLPPISLGTGRTATAVTAAATFTCARLDDGRAKCWGDNGSGQLGVGDAIERGASANEMGDALAAVALGAGRTAVAVTTGGDHVCARLDNGGVRCWGSNGSGRLGLGNTANRGDDPGELGDALPYTTVLGPAIGGRVTGFGAAPVAGAMVVAMRLADYSIVGGDDATAAGTYAIPVDPDADYLLYLVDPTATHNPGFFGGPTVIHVADRQATTDPSMAPRLGAISGTVTETGGGTPVAGAYVIALNASGAFETATTTNASGQYTLTRLRPGTHHVGFVDPAGAHGVRYHPSAPDIGSDTPVTVTAGATTTGADGTVPVQPMVGTGSVILGHTAASAMVIALRSSDLSFARATRANGTGGYALNLAAGSYDLAFIDPTGRHLPEWYDDQPLSGLGSASPVVAPGLANGPLTSTVGQISGTITLGGAPSTSWVMAIGPSALEGATVTAAQGTYTVNDLPPGNYRAAIVHPLTGRYEYWMDASTFDGGAVFPVVAGDDSPVDADL